MKYIEYILKRLIYSLVVLFGLSVIIFIISRVIPGDPARMALGPHATREQVEALRQSMGLNLSLVEQYFMYIGNLFRGDFGISLISRRNVLVDLRLYFPATLELIIYTIIWVVIIGVPMGVISAAKKDSKIDNFFKTLSFSAVVAPAFIIGLAFQLIFGYALNIMPITGRLSSALTAPPESVVCLALMLCCRENFRSFLILCAIFFYLLLPYRCLVSARFLESQGPACLRLAVKIIFLSCILMEYQME